MESLNLKINYLIYGIGFPYITLNLILDSYIIINPTTPPPQNHAKSPITFPD